MILEGTRSSNVAVGSNLKGNAPGDNWRLILPSLELREGAGLVVASTPDALRRLGAPGEPQLGEAGSSVYLDLGGPRARRAGRDAVQRIRSAVGRPLRTLWVTPSRGEIESIVPADDALTVAFFAARGLVAAGGRRDPFSRAVRALKSATGRGSKVSSGVDVKASRQAAIAVPGDGPPAYVVSIAREAGIALDAHRWGLWAPRDYASQKAVLFLFPDEAEAPEYVVKIARDPRLNTRLANEHRSLEALARLGLADDGAIPRTAFFATHAGVAILGEGAVEGIPYRDATEASPRCPHAGAAVRRLTELAEVTADRTTTASEIAEALRDLLDRFCAVYALSPGHRDFLDRQLERLAGRNESLPSVFLHGDAGIWNVLVQPGNATFLDWEASEQNGIPLWDLFAFLRSHGVWAARRNGGRDAMKAFERQHLETSEFNDLLVGETATYCERVGLSPSDVEPLFYFTWVHRGLREASRLRPGHVDEGTFVGLLRRCIDAHEAPGLRRLFSLEGDRSGARGA